MEEEFKAGEIGNEVPLPPEDLPEPMPAPEPPHEPEEEVHSLADNVRSLTPMQLVAKRFFRSKLSIVGLCIIIFLFAFCWLGPLFSPYGEETIDEPLPSIGSVRQRKDTTFLRVSCTADAYRSP